MKKYQMPLWTFITFIILLTGFKKETQLQNNLIERSARTKGNFRIFTEPVKVSIAGTSVIKSDKGQRPVKLMIYLSKPTTEKVSVEYSTKDGSARAGVDYVATTGSVTFEPGETAKWITVFIVGQVAADPDEDAPVAPMSQFIVELKKAINAIVAMSNAYISILPLIPANLSGNEAVYEVIISFTGYTSFGGTFDECGVRKDGVVVLSGFLSGRESADIDDDIVYTGTLEMIINIDICSTHRLPNGQDDYCGIRVDGTGTVFTELELITGRDKSGKNFEGRGGYIKIENKDGKFTRTVTGSCADGQIDEERTMVPNESISSVFNGMELPMLTDRTLRKGIYPKKTAEGEIVVEVLRKIR